MVAIGAIVCATRIGNFLSLRHGVGSVRRMEPARHSLHQLHRPGGQHGNMGRNQEHISTCCTGRTLEAAKDVKQQESQAPQRLERMQGELKDFQVCLENAFREFKEAYRNLEDAGRGLWKRNGKLTTVSEVVGRLRTSTTAYDVRANLKRTPRKPHTRCRAASQIGSQTRSVISKKRSI